MKSADDTTTPSYECPCGMYGWDAPDLKRSHTLRHREWERGIPLPRSAPTDQAVLIVPGNGPFPLRWLAYRMARVARRDAHFDNASFEPPYRGVSEDWEEYQVTAFLAVQDAHAVAYAVVRLRQQQLLIYRDGEKIQFGSSPVPYEKSETARPCVDLIFTAGAYRRQGMIRRLAHAITAHYHQEHPSRLLWGAPFSEQGLPTILALTEGTLWVG